MPTQQLVPWFVPPILSFVAGFVDGCTFLALFGLFVAQVTGSFVIAAAQLVTLDPEGLIKILAIPVFFLAGIITTMGAVIVSRRGRRPLPFMLALESILLIAFLSFGLLGAPFTSANAPLSVVTSLLGLTAMGVQSAFVRLLMRNTASTNVMTTNTTQIAIDLSELMLSRRSVDAEAAAAVHAARGRLRGLFPIAGGFALGTVGGALGYTLAGLSCLLLVIAISLSLCVWSLLDESGSPRDAAD